MLCKAAGGSIDRQCLPVQACEKKKMDLGFLAETFDFVGKLIIILMALAVHDIVRKEGKIDYHIVCKMKRERWGAYVGVLFLVVAYVIEIFMKYG